MSFLDRKTSIDLSRYNKRSKNKKVKPKYNPDQGIGKNGAKKYLKDKRDGL